MKEHSIQLNSETTNWRSLIPLISTGAVSGHLMERFCWPTICVRSTLYYILMMMHISMGAVADFWSSRWNYWIKIISSWPCCLHIWHLCGEAIGREFDQSFHNVYLRFLLQFEKASSSLQSISFIWLLLLSIVSLGSLRTSNAVFSSTHPSSQ